MNIKERMIEVARQAGADLVGITPVERLAGAPAGHKPTDLMPDARSVIVLASRMPREVIANTSRLTFYTKAMAAKAELLDQIAYKVAAFLEEQGAKVLPVPADDPYTDWNAEERHGAGEVSHKHAAVTAGMGTLGKNTLLVTPEFGNRVALVSILTDLSLEPDEPLTHELCISSCSRCIEACPAGAITPEGRVIQKLCREHCGTTLPRGFGAYSCWECRRVCPHGGGGDYEQR